MINPLDKIFFVAYNPNFPCAASVPSNAFLGIQVPSTSYGLKLTQMYQAQ